MAIARLPMLFAMLAAGLAAGAAAQRRAAAQLPQSQQKQAAQPARDRATVRLPFSGDWTPTNVRTEAGDQLILIARGLPLGPIEGQPPGAPPPPPLDPAGAWTLPSIPRVDSTGAWRSPTIRFRAPDAPYLSVIARIGDRVFFVGPAYRGPAPASGMIELAVNMTPGAGGGGGVRPGTALFEVTVEHASPPAPDRQPSPDPEPDANTLNSVEVAPLPERNESVVNEAAPKLPANEPAVADPAARDRGESAPGQSWLVPLLIGAAGALALVLVGHLLKNALRPKPLPTLTVGVHPSLDRGEGGVSGDETALAGPEVRLRTRLERGATIFDGEEPVIEREERDG